MLVEKYIIVGVKHPKEVVTDIIKQSSYDYNVIINPISIIKESKNDVFVDFDGPFVSKTKAMIRLEEIWRNVSNIAYWSILPVMVNVSTEEARYIKLKRINKKIKRK